MRRMEEAYLRMEESNRQVQLEYKTLLKKYDELSQAVSNGKDTLPTGARPPTVGRNPFGGARLSVPVGTRSTDARSIFLEALEAEVKPLPDSPGRATSTSNRAPARKGPAAEPARHNNPVAVPRGPVAAPARHNSRLRRVGRG